MVRAHLTPPSKGTLVPEKDSPNTAGLSLCLQNATGYGSLSRGFARVHDSAHRSDFRPHNSSTKARNDAHPSLQMEKARLFLGNPWSLGASLHGNQCFHLIQLRESAFSCTQRIYAYGVKKFVEKSQKIRLNCCFSSGNSGQTSV